MLRFEYRLAEVGWAEAIISDGDLSFEMIVSYLSDPLGDLARSVIALLHGQKRVTFSMWDEPGEYRWRLIRTGDLVDIRIRAFRTHYADGKLLLSITLPLSDLAWQVTNQLREILEQYGEDGYREQWVLFAFPRTQYETLLRIRRERRQHNVHDP